jgi:hypothetical protein
MDFNLVENAAALANKMRLHGSGGASLGHTTDPGAGIFSANTGFWIGTSAPASGTFPQSDAAAYKNSTYGLPTAIGPNGHAIVSNGTDTVFADIQEDSLNAYAALGGAVVAQVIGGHISNITNFRTMQDNGTDFTAIYIHRAMTVTGVKFFQATQGVYTADNNNKIGLYSYSGGTLTKVAESADNGNLWKGTPNNWRTQAFSSPYVASPGLYFVSALYNQSAQTTAPTIGAMAPVLNATVSTMDFTNSATFTGLAPTTNDLPASQSIGGLTVAVARPYFALY